MRPEGKPLCPFSFKTSVEVKLQAFAPVQARIAGTAVLEASTMVAIYKTTDGVCINFVAKVTLAGIVQSSSLQSQTAGLTINLKVVLIVGYALLP